ncbi:MAG: GNAT family N-acetyltransferase [Firmicutes bacterium HGW-Firmicutes-1]|nr:MAG: GNAT family N-acetyltransferase [Firmicutes bacterium HGW-Firmicutes-1]
MKLEFKKAHTNQDCLLLYKWVNDPLTRKNAFNTEFISFEEHNKWFRSKMNDPNTVIYICVEKEEMKVQIGQVRLDFTNHVGIIDYYVDSQFRGKGFGSEMLKLLPDQLIKDEFVFSELIGKVKNSNVASEKAFLKAGYQLEITNGWKEFKWLNQDR